MKNKIAITIGDPAGIGPEIIIKALDSLSDNNKYLLIGNKDLFTKTAKNINTKIPDNIEIIDVPCDISKINIGQVGIESGRLSFLALHKACELTNNKEIRAIVTAPLSKKAINLAGFNFSGQTEILQKYLAEDMCLSNKAEMLFVSKDFRVLLLTRHIKLASVSESLKPNNIIESINALNNSLIKDFKVLKPKLAICGLNPHSGEDGLIGNEEKAILIPVINTLKQKYNIDIAGPFPADTLWIKAAKPYLNSERQPYDAYIACYHDQGLIPIKLLAMDSTVNTTINLPIIRTSPSHGTAFDIAGKNIADFSSMRHAIDLADTISG
ncbi:MAG: 4-hydroxythreonine-4-phosphate dehydrogenase PdxA [Candidatus Gastranaerophilales bacterium]|nr:4-hydroxythreonine-4-phosphate dehydrogenase PdxA [Candidatus Gastranaerophilales bacterium]